MARVVLENVSKSFPGGVRAVEGLTLTIPDGEFLVLLGPSGCGKSTVLRLIAGLEEVSSGEIRIGNRDVTSLPARERDIAMVFQNYALYPHMTCFENIAFGLRMRKLPEHEIRRKVDWAADLLGIVPLLERRPKALSGGERQRIALGRALVREPAVFLFDEPLSNLDARLRVQMRHEITAIHRRFRTSSIYVTHDQFEAMTMGHRIAVLKGGELQQVATPKEIYEQPANRFVAEFIGTPSINILTMHVDRGENCLVADEFSLPLPEIFHRLSTAPEKVDIGIRPERFSLAPIPDSVALQGQIIRIEHLGGEHHLYAQLGSQVFVARAFGDAPTVNEGDTITLHARMEELLVFDHETGRAIDRG